jgi:indolepyruvate ferredoxin oxidoreductase
VRIADRPERLHAVRIGTGAADLLLGCDLVVSASFDGLSRVSEERTTAIVNAQDTVTGDFTRNPDWAFPASKLQSMIQDAARTSDFPDATRLATALMGDAIATNPFMLGYAYQRGLLPVSGEAIQRAIELNNVAVEFNKRAFHWGRRAAVDPAGVARAAAPTPAPKIPETLEEIVAHRRAHLTGYQNPAYADRYQALVDRAAAAERERTPGMSGFALAVARSHAKLLAYKDEYEVARLYTDGAFADKLAAQFEGAPKLKVHLAPPLWAKRDAAGHLQKRAYGGWVLAAFRLLAKLKVLRGTAFDPFGRTAERIEERRLIADYERLIEETSAALSPANHAAALALASLPEQIRGFGHVKAQSLRIAQQREAELRAAFREAQPRSRAAQ